MIPCYQDTKKSGIINDDPDFIIGVIHIGDP